MKQSQEQLKSSGVKQNKIEHEGKNRRIRKEQVVLPLCLSKPKKVRLLCLSKLRQSSFFVKTSPNLLFLSKQKK